MQTEESNEIPNLDHDQPGRDGVFEHVEGTRFRVNILYQFVDEHSEPLRGRVLQDHHYAPTTASAKYLKLTPNFVDRIFLKGYGNVKRIPITPGLSKKQEDAVLQDCKEHKVSDTHTAWFLPVRFVAALAKNKVDWDTIENGGDPDSGRSVGDIDDEDFVEEWAQEWFAVTDGAGFKIQNTHGIVFVPLRASNGGLRAVKCNSDLKIKSLGDAKDYKHTWMVALEELLVKSTTGGSSRKFNRSVDLPMANGLKFQILKFAESRFGSMEAAEEALTDGIELLNKLTKPCAIKQDKLAVVLDTPDNNWMKLSTNPFELYSTYVHKDDWHAYMQGLGPVVAGVPSPIRYFRATASDELNEMTADIQGTKPMFSDPDGVRNSNAASNTTNKNNTPPANVADDASSQIIGVDDEDKTSRTDIAKGQRILIVPLSEAKRRAAVGRRKDADDQYKVIVKNSASQIAESMGWSFEVVPQNSTQSPHLLSNSLYMAEWTHLAAFSYGGLLDHKDREKNSKGDTILDQGKSCQVPINLVLGTSETNSLMTRYESAWQTLFDKETELWKDWRKKKDLQKFKATPGLEEDKATLPFGQLFLNCNDPDVVLRYDKRNPNGVFTWEEHALVDSAEQHCLAA
ncbi:hypothetical protein SCHPADRAFT_200774 [Schizopora paradoxa]|uniref:Uncharacterized protein n=1 Tax=Schizopora paradoxa TaxID=27342 RepID=A0A0H2SI60_9AGAM|nr:hypothetical protein SCHPADRAFT_200774 [Schizopora paradoxa]